MKRRKRFIRIRETLLSFDLLYKEINEYNTTFWSKFLGVFWLTFGPQITLLFYLVLFFDLNLPLLIIFSYTLLTLTQIFLFVIFTASSVNYCANKSYLIMNSFLISYSKHNTRPSSISTKLKVTLLSLNEILNNV